ncbi:MAG: cache domain-containing protein, partial [Nitrospirae bacterium]|nr:cache domain-containing protein [Nitrospirota bacterium]
DKYKNNSHVKDLIKELNQISNIHDLYKSIQLTDNSGVIIASTDSTEIGTNISQEDFYIDATKRLFASYFSVRPEIKTNQLIIKYTNRLNIGNNTYYLIMNISLDNFIKPILNADIDSANTNSIVLSGPNFAFVVHANKVILQKPEKIKSIIMSHISDGNEGSII